MKTILVPVDFSSTSINAMRFAFDVASLSGGAVHLLNVIEVPAMPNTAFTPVRSLGVPLMKEMSAKARTGFEKIIEKYNKDGVNVISTVEFGVPSRTILKYAKKNSVDIIVMGSHGASGVKEYFLGSNAARIIRTSPLPVIVVKNFYKGPVKDIVLPCGQESDGLAGLMVKVKELQKYFKSHLHLVYVNTPANFALDSVTVPRLTALAKKYQLQDYTVSVYNHVYEEEGIIQFTESIGADMIAMGTHARKGLSRIINGSKAEAVANHGKSLIWTYGIGQGKSN